MALFTNYYVELITIEIRKVSRFKIYEICGINLQVMASASIVQHSVIKLVGGRP